MSAQDSDAGRVKRADPYAAGAVFYLPVYTLPHFSRRFIGKRNCHNIPWIHLFFFN